MKGRVSSCEVAIVGGGVIGAACARAAALRGILPAIFERGPEPGAASPASAGMLAAQIEPADQVMLALAVRARDLYEDLAASLKDTTGIDIGFWRGGIGAVAFDQERAAELREAVNLQRQAGLRCDWLEPDDLHERWPGAAPEALGALFSPEDGAVTAPALAQALIADAKRLGASTLAERVERVLVTAGKVTGLKTASGTVSTDRVVIAAGAWSPRLEGLPRPLPVEPIRGQLSATAWPRGTPPAILYGDHHYVLARGDEAVLGSTMEHVGFECQVTADGLAQIRRSVERLLPALRDLPQLRAWAGLRPVTPDGRPVLGPDPEVSGLFYATGHGRNGILLAALSGATIADLLATGATELDLEPFRPDRPMPTVTAGG